MGQRRLLNAPTQVLYQLVVVLRVGPAAPGGGSGGLGGDSVGPGAGGGPGPGGPGEPGPCPGAIGRTVWKVGCSEEQLIVSLPVYRATPPEDFTP